MARVQKNRLQLNRSRHQIRLLEIIPALQSVGALCLCYWKSVFLSLRCTSIRSCLRFPQIVPDADEFNLLFSGSVYVDSVGGNFGTKLSITEKYDAHYEGSSKIVLVPKTYADDCE